MRRLAPLVGSAACGLSLLFFSSCVGDEPATSLGGGTPDSGSPADTGAGAVDARADAANDTGTTDSGQDAGPFDPSKLPGIALWLEADKAAHNGANAVTSWADGSGNANHATPPTPANGPTFVASTLNGHAVLRFNGTSSYLRIADSVSLGFGPTGSNPFVLEMVVTYPMGNPNGALALFAKFGVSIIGPQLNAYKDSTGTAFSGQVDTEAAVFGKYILPYGTTRVMMQWTPNATPPGGTLSVREGGSLAATKPLGSATTLASSAPAYIGTSDYGSGPGMFYRGDIAELVLFSPQGTIQAADIAAVETYLNTKYGL